MQVSVSVPVKGGTTPGTHCKRNFSTLIKKSGLVHEQESEGNTRKKRVAIDKMKKRKVGPP